MTIGRQKNLFVIMLKVYAKWLALFLCSANAFSVLSDGSEAQKPEWKKNWSSYEWLRVEFLCTTIWPCKIVESLAELTLKVSKNL